MPRVDAPSDLPALGHADLARLADECGEHWLLVLVLGTLGLRFGELAGLCIRDVDLLRRRLRVARNAVEVAGRVHVGSPKSGRERAVPIPGHLLDAVAAQVAGRGPDEPLFPSPEGGVLRLSNWSRRVFKPACQRAGYSGLNVHGLRHVAASLAIASGANVLAVARLLGHNDPALTLRVYASLFEDDLDALGDRLAEASRTAGGRPTVTPLRPAR